MTLHFVDDGLYRHWVDTMITRRRLLSNALAGTIAAPFLRIFNNRALAQPMQGPKRLMIFFSPDGMVPSLWRPPTNGSRFEILPNQILAPLQPHQDDLIILDGIDFLTGNNHEGGMAAMLTNGTGGVTNGSSVDQVIASHIGSDDRFKSLEFGILTDPWGASIQTRMCYSESGQFIHPDADPQKHVQTDVWRINQDAQALENLQRGGAVYLTSSRTT